MFRRKIGTARHKPEGHWVQTTSLFEVAGISHRYDQVKSWVEAVRAAEDKNQLYGIDVCPEPTNPYDPNAICIMGFADTKNVLGIVYRKTWHLGYVPKELAAELSQDLLSQGAPMSAELYDIQVVSSQHRELYYVRGFVLGPNGMSRKNRQINAAVERGSLHALIEKAKASNDTVEQEELLVQWCESEIKTNATEGIAPRPFFELAKLFHKQKRYQDELDLLKHWDGFPKPRGALVAELENRIEKLRSRCF